MTAAHVHHGDCLDVLRTLPDASVDAIVTDPPYELGFMGKTWDGSGIAYSVELWAECLRVLRPGGHLAAFGGTRTYHRMACAVEDAGFEIRDSLTWLYGSGFPKSLDVSKAIDKAAGAEREVVGSKLGQPGYSLAANAAPATALRIRNGSLADAEAECAITAPATPAAEQWQGWGTALKPAQEPIVLARRPLSGTVAGNVLAHGTGALNIDASRVAHDEPSKTATRTAARFKEDGVRFMGSVPERSTVASADPAGRWPANVLLSHGPDCADVCTPGCPVAELDAQSGTSKSVRSVRVHPGGVIGNGNTHGAFIATEANVGGFDDSGGASRFFPVFRYQAKARSKERPSYLDANGVKIAHPTVKPLDLMRWLVRLVTPPGGLVLDPFAGSGTTVEATLLEGFDVIAVEREAAYLPLIEQRIARAA